MKAIDTIRMTLEMNDLDMCLFEDMRDLSVAQPTTRGGNHPLWTLGHLAVTEGSFHGMITGEANALEHWTPLFGGGTQPKTDADAYPPFDEVLNAYREQRARNMALLERIGDAGLDQPPKSPPAEAADLFRTIGQAFLLMASHHAFHSGQVADARRAAGRTPLRM